MPIYAYRCEACGFDKDVLQKISDPQLTVCPSCNAPSFKKQITAAGFQLKGSGWYATDFRNGSNNKPADGKGEKSAEASGDGKESNASASDSTKNNSEKTNADAAPAASSPSNSTAGSPSTPVPSTAKTTPSPGA